MEEIRDIESPEEEFQDSELSHSDKAIGVLTEPSNTYAETAKYPPKTIDWLLPLTLLLLVVAISNILMMSDENIAYEIKQKQRAAIEKRFDEAVQKGQMTQQQADEQMDRIEEGMAMGGPITLIVTVITIFIGGFLMFFLVTGLYFLFVKLLFKGDGTFSSALVANGLTSYIGIIQVLAATILAFVLGKLVRDVSLASFLNLEPTSIEGFILGKIDIISIWAYLVLGIGLAKMFKSQSTGKYIALVFTIWVIGGLLWFLMVKYIPFLSFMGG